MMYDEYITISQQDKRRPAKKRKQKKKRSVRGEVLSWVQTISGVFFIVTLVQHFVFISVAVEGRSMQPSFEDGDRVILWQLFYEPQLFDVIVLEQPFGRRDIKRIVGMPGDRVDYLGGVLHINHQPVEEIHTLDEMSVRGFYFEDICQFDDCHVIPPGYYLVLGDNRNNSGDSRDNGLVAREQIMGGVMWRYYPFETFGSTR